MKTIYCDTLNSTKHIFHEFEINKVIARVPKDVAYIFLLTNLSMIKDGKTYWFTITHRGLSVYDIEISLIEKETRLTN